MDTNFDGLKVMVIDDSKTIRRTAETLLQKAGCEVITAVDGFDALAKIAESNRHYFCGHHDAPFGWLSNLCPYQKQSRLRSKSPSSLSSKDGLFDKARGRIVGSDEYLTKPFSKDELFDAIKQYQS